MNDPVRTILICVCSVLDSKSTGPKKKTEEVAEGAGAGAGGVLDGVKNAAAGVTGGGGGGGGGNPLPVG